MNIAINLSHVTLLVPSLEKSMEMLPADIYHIADIEAFEEKIDGGSRETYIGPKSYAKGMLLLVQGTTSRWFSQFAKKFGYGLHHIAIDVPSVVDYCEAMYEKGWYLHIGSALSLQTHQAVYLVRHGLPLIIEVQGHKTSKNSTDYFINKVVIGVNNEEDKEAILNLGISELCPQLNVKSSFQIVEKIWDIAEITCAN